jgi:hypothetical protein
MISPLDVRRLARCLAPVAAAWLAIAARPTVAAAQVPNLVDLSAQYTPPARDDDPKSTESQLSSYQLNINLPIPLGARRFMIVGAAYHTDVLSYSQMPTNAEMDRAFHAAELSVLYAQVLDSHWVLSARVGTSLSGDFDSVDRRMLGFGAIALASKPLSRELTLGGGGLVTTGFGSTLPLPAFLINWRPIDGVLIESLLPAFASARYTAWDRVEVGVRLEVGGAKYGVRDAKVTQAYPCAGQATDNPATSADETMARPDQCLDHISYTVGSIGLLAGVRLTSTIWLTAFAGVSVYRHAEEQNRSGDAIDNGVQSLPQTLFVRTNLSWRIPRS